MKYQQGQHILGIAPDQILFNSELIEEYPHILVLLDLQKTLLFHFKTGRTFAKYLWDEKSDI